MTNAGALTWIAEMLDGPSSVPTAFATFPHDLLPPLREWAE